MGQCLHSNHVGHLFPPRINNNPSRSQIDYAAAGYDLVATAIQEGVKTACAAIPGIEIAPLGAGIEAKPDNICEQVVDFVRSMVDLPVGFAFAAHDYAMEEEGFNACNPFQVGFSRVFCNLADSQSEISFIGLQKLHKIITHLHYYIDYIVYNY